MRATPITAITATTGKGVRVGDTEYELDVLIFATGFDATTGTLTNIDIVGRNGLTLREKWAAEGLRSNLGINAHGFPNFFMSLGPQPPYPNLPVPIQPGAQWLQRAIRWAEENGVERLEATPESEQWWAAAVTDLDGPAGAETAGAITAAGGRARFWPVDVSEGASVASGVAAAVAEFGTLDILINCAGIIGVDKPTHEVSEAEWDALFAVDVKGVFFATKHVIPHRIAAGGGSVVNFSSIYGLPGNDEFTPYHVAKGAVTMQTRQDAATYGRYNIRVNSVHPSTVLTPLVEGIADAYPGSLPAYEETMTAHQSLKRLGRPIDVAYGVLYLASDEAGWVTGVNLPLDGGYTAR